MAQQFQFLTQWFPVGRIAAALLGLFLNQGSGNMVEIARQGGR
jgi:hypothetical protein